MFGMFRHDRESWTSKAWRELFAGIAVLACVLNGCSNFSGREPVRVQVTMKKYSFDPAVIRVKQGDWVELAISTADVQHGFAIPDLDIREPVPRGRTATVRFRAERKGQFKIRCSILCGPGHDEMQGTLIVE
ncbi:MAG: cupredoxin domain-containing protein [Acidobacteria bacterium]|nr:cupredoxin domain-containing protein [Acidobacteriota bacterium]